MSKDFAYWFVWFKLHLTRVWSVMNIPVQLFQLLLLVLVSVKNSSQAGLYWAGFFLVFVVGSLLWYWDSKEKGMFEAETTYTMSKNVLMLNLEKQTKENTERLKRIESKLNSL